MDLAKPFAFSLNILSAIPVTSVSLYTYLNKDSSKYGLFFAFEIYSGYAGVIFSLCESYIEAYGLQ